MVRLDANLPRVAQIDANTHQRELKMYEMSVHILYMNLLHECKEYICRHGKNVGKVKLYSIKLNFLELSVNMC